MTTKAGAGHFGPLIPFARAFQRAGADVLVAAPREAAPMVAGRGPAAVGLRRSARAGARRDLRRGARPGPPTPASTGASWATSSRASTPARPSPGCSPRAGRGGPTSSSARSPSSPGRWRPSSSACLRLRRHLPAGQGGVHAPPIVDGARGAARRASAWRPTPAPSACSRRPYFTLSRPRWRIPPRPALGRAAPLPRAARAPCAATGLRRPGGRAAARLRHLRLGGAEHGLLPGPLPRRHRGARPACRCACW